MKTYQNQAQWCKADEASPFIIKRLEHFRRELRSNSISIGELAELENLADYIPMGDVELLEAAGVPEYEDSE